jgi:microcystin-dependent protein
MKHLALALLLLLPVALTAGTLYPVTPPIKLYTDKAGKPLDLGYIYFGVANQNPEVTPVQMYWDAAGTIPAAQPVRTVAGYITRQGTPANIYASGDFSITIRDSKRALVCTSPNSTDIQLALAVTGSGAAASIPIADADGHYTTDNVEQALKQVGDDGFVTRSRLAAEVLSALIPTGTTLDFVGTTAPTGFVMGTGGRTICSAASGSGPNVERANDDTLALYTLLWNSYANAQLPIQDSSGTPTTRGLSASNDFAAGKKLPLPDCAGRARAGRESVASRLTSAVSGVDGATLGSAAGVQSVALSEANLASHFHTLPNTQHRHTGGLHGHTVTDTHTHGYSAATYATQKVDPGVTIFAAVSNGAASTGFTNSGSIAVGSSSGGAVLTSNEETGITQTNSKGSGTAHANVQPTIIFNVIIKL